jgi:hypothetical protein
MTAEIYFKCLRWTETGDVENKRHPISTLPGPHEHIHGQLEIIIAGKPLPSLGYLGPDDVCINTWVQELMTILSALDSFLETGYVFDEGEQGQPAYEFRREFDLLFVSVIDSKISGGRGDPRFQSISCMWFDFVASARKCLAELREDIEREAGDIGKAWWLANAYPQD